MAEPDHIEICELYGVWSHFANRLVGGVDSITAYENKADADDIVRACSQNDSQMRTVRIIARHPRDKKRIAELEGALRKIYLMYTSNLMAYREKSHEIAYDALHDAGQPVETDIDNG